MHIRIIYIDTILARKRPLKKNRFYHLKLILL
jgi:hypothetical protein